MPTATYTTSASSTASATSVVNRKRSRFRSRSSWRPSSWIGTLPRRSASIFSATTSRTTTSCPRSAKQAPVTRPTYPAPKTAIFMPGYLAFPSGLRPFAIASIVSLESRSRSVLTTQ